MGRPRIAQVFTSVDGTERYLVQGQGVDALTVETVWMPEGDDGEAGDDGSDNYGLRRTSRVRSGTGPPSACRARWAARSTASFA